MGLYGINWLGVAIMSHQLAKWQPYRALVSKITFLGSGGNARNLAFGTAELARIGRLNQYILHVEQIQPCNLGRTLGFNSNGVNLQCPVFVDIRRNPFPVISPMAAMALLSVGSLWLVKALSFLNPACWLVETALVPLEKNKYIPHITVYSYILYIYTIYILYIYYIYTIHIYI